MDIKSSTSETSRQQVMPLTLKTLRWRIALLGIILLLSGIVIGAGGTFIFGRRIILRTIRKGPDPGRIATRIEKDLDLSSQQVKRVEEILATRLKKVRQIRRDNRLPIYHQFELMKKEISDVLDQGQAQKWNQRANKLMRFRPRPKPPGGIP